MLFQRCAGLLDTNEVDYYEANFFAAKKHTCQALKGDVSGPGELDFVWSGQAIHMQYYNYI